MENRNNVLVIPLLVIIILLSWGLINNYNQFNVPLVEMSSCKEDSLRRVISDLQIEIENEEDGWDKKEKRYEQTLFEYEMGLDHLKHYHLTAYKEFHRIIGYKENYSHEVERENKKRLKNGNTLDLWR
jgi:hypothetical protein